MKTWKLELAVVAMVLGTVVVVTRGGLLEAVGALAVLAAFAHAQVTERMREKQAAKTKPDVHCHRWSLRYFMAKELLWLSYFIAHRSWSALVGVAVFLLYPLWRRWWRARRPMALKRVMLGPTSLVYVNGRQLELIPGSDIVVGKPWSAGLAFRLDRSGCEFLATVSRAQADTNFFFRMGPDHMTGHARPKRLQFWDDPKQPDVRFASFHVQGTDELQHV